MTHDRTRAALERQLRGLAQEKVEITVKGPDRTFIRVMTPQQILDDLPQMKRANLAGCHLYVRGRRDLDHDLVLLDDVPRFVIDRMKEAGHQPAVFIETSPGNCQAWLRLGRPCSSDLRHEIARSLADAYSGDRGAVDPHQSGRLAGFTNRKQEYKTARGFPYVLLLNAPGRPAKNAEKLIADARAVLARRPTPPAVKVVTTSEIPEDLLRFWLQEYEARRGGDLSEIDWSITHQLFSLGVDPDAIASTLSQVADRKGKAAAQYAERTVRNALQQRMTSSIEPS